jgi:formiminotetrahydrofolate cyclodeaminase
MLGLKKKPTSNEIILINSLQSNSASKVPNDILEKIFKCINVLTEIASQSYRNVILDQVWW